jgi:hypothetical protein
VNRDLVLPQVAPVGAWEAVLPAAVQAVALAVQEVVLPVGDLPAVVALRPLCASPRVNDGDSLGEHYEISITATLAFGYCAVVIAQMPTLEPRATVMVAPWNNGRPVVEVTVLVPIQTVPVPLFVMMTEVRVVGGVPLVIWVGVCVTAVCDVTIAWLLPLLVVVVSMATVPSP